MQHKVSLCTHASSEVSKQEHTKSFELKLVTNTNTFPKCGNSKCIWYYHFRFSIQIRKPVLKLSRILAQAQFLLGKLNIIEGGVGVLENKWWPTSELNSLSNNRTSTLSGLTPGEGSATQCSTPCGVEYINRWIQKWVSSRSVHFEAHFQFQ